MSDPLSEAQDAVISTFLSIERRTRHNMIHLVRVYLAGSESTAFPDALKRLSTLYDQQTDAGEAGKRA